MGIAEKTVRKKNEKIKKANVTIIDYNDDVLYYDPESKEHLKAVSIGIGIDQCIEPQMRPRKGGFGNLYDPLEKYKNILREKVKEQLEINNIKIDISEDKYIKSTIVVIKEPPSTLTKKEKLYALLGKFKFNKKPDIDNCVKTIYDSFEKIFFFNDSQVITETFTKRYGTQDYTKIYLDIFDQPKITGRLTKKELEKYSEDIVNYINNT